MSLFGRDYWFRRLFRQLRFDDDGMRAGKFDHRSRLGNDLRRSWDFDYRHWLFVGRTFGLRRVRFSHWFAQTKRLSNRDIGSGWFHRPNCRLWRQLHDSRLRPRGLDGSRGRWGNCRWRGRWRSRRLLSGSLRFDGARRFKARRWGCGFVFNHRFEGRIWRKGYFRCGNAGFDDDVGWAANHDQMFDAVATNQHQPAASIDRCGI
jgi:hypothetical protein